MSQYKFLKNDLPLPFDMRQKCLTDVRVINPIMSQLFDRFDEHIHNLSINEFPLSTQIIRHCIHQCPFASQRDKLKKRVPERRRTTTLIDEV